MPPIPDMPEKESPKAKAEKPKEGPGLRQMPIEEFLKQLPPGVKGAAKVERFEVPGAKRCLVHIRQTHNDPLTDMDQRVREMRGEKDGVDGDRMRNVQTDIHMILLDLRTRFGPIDVHMEGVTDDATLKEIEQMNRAIDRALKDLRAKRAESADDKDLAKLNEQIDQAQRAKDALALALLAPGYMAKRGMVRLVPGDDEQATTRATDLFRKLKALMEEAQELIKVPARGRDAGRLATVTKEMRAANNEYKDVAYTKREDALLKQLQQEKRMVAVTVFGSTHDWRDNIEKWNKENPDEKVSLVVITPRTYEKKETRDEMLRKR